MAERARYTGTSDDCHDVALSSAILALVALYVIGDLTTRGMALDGLVYADVAKLLASGEGSFWKLPSYDPFSPGFSEHPPLGIWLLSIWMQLVGSAFWAEKLFAGICLAACFGLTAIIWSELSGERSWWWPWFLLAIMPASTYTLKNNYLESTLVLASLLAVWAALRAHATANRRRLIWQLVLSLAVLAGFLIKGPVGLFPLVAPALIILTKSVAEGPSWRAAAWCRAAVATSIPLAFFLVELGILLVGADARDALDTWWRRQVLASVAADRPIVHGRAYQLENMATNLVPPLVLVGIVWWRNGRQPFRREAVAMLLVGLAAALPLLLSARQFRHYLLPALPVLAIGLGMIARPTLRSVLSTKVICGIVAALFALVFARGYFEFGKIGKDKDEQDLAVRVSAKLPVGQESPLILCPRIADFYKLQVYLFRNHDIRSGGPERHLLADRRAWSLCTESGSSSSIDLGKGFYLTAPIVSGDHSKSL